MTDDRDTTSGGDDDGLDAWLAANFPPKPEVPKPEAPAPPATPPPAPPAVPPALVPPALVPPVQSDLPAWPPVPPTVPDAPVFPPMSEELSGVPSAPEFPPPPTEAFADVGGASGIDSLFGETKFVDYDDEPAPSENPFARGSASEQGVQSGAPGQRAEIPTSQKTLIWIAVSLVAVLALLALFIFGTKLPALLGPAPAVITAPSVTPSPTSTTQPIGPVDPGVHRWNQLLGGECVDPYPGPWENEYTVVDCESPHPAQLVTRGAFDTEPGVAVPYPGMDALQSQVNLLCTSPTVVNYAKAKAYSDIQFEASFAPSAAEWDAGNHYYYCFLSRSTGGTITGSIAVPQVAPTPTPSPTPSP